MSILNSKRNKGGFMDQIRCDDSNYLIWKWHPKGVQRGESNRENAIRWGSSLRVKDGEVAIFVYKQKDGTMQDYIEGPFDKIIDTKNFPVLASIVGLAYEGGTPFQAEIYFINLARINQIKFGVPYFDVYDPRFTDFGVPVAVRGTITFSIKNYKEFIKLNRLNTFTLDDFEKQVRDVISLYVKNVVTNITAKYNIPLIQIESKISFINDEIEYDLKTRLYEHFGVSVSGVDLSAIDIDKTSNAYRELMSVTKDITSATIKAETEAKLKDIEDKQRIDSFNYEETLRIQREEAQYAQRKQTQSSNLNAFQIEKQTEVGIAGAEALGKMAQNGAGNINLGGNENGFNMAALMASMAVGGAVGQNIAGTMNNMMSNMGQVQQNTPPPVPTVMYHVAKNGQATGPYDIAALCQMAITGEITNETLVWTNGMTEWAKIEDINDLKDIIVTIPPLPIKK